MTAYFVLWKRPTIEGRSVRKNTEVQEERKALQTVIYAVYWHDTNYCKRIQFSLLQGCTLITKHKTTQYSFCKEARTMGHPKQDGGIQTLSIRGAEHLLIRSMWSKEHLLCQPVLMEKEKPMPQLLICYKMPQLCLFQLLIYVNRKSFLHSAPQANISTSQQFLATPAVVWSQAEHELLQLIFELA